MPGLILDIEGHALSDEDRRLLLQPQVSGIILFSRNFRDKTQLCKLTGSIKNLRSDLLICVDQEGGRVQRFREGFTRLPSISSLAQFCGQQMDGNERLAAMGWLMAAELIKAGVDLSFAPVLDIDRGDSEVIGDRSFGCDAATIAQQAGYYIGGMQRAGMCATGKHFPGHGGVGGDSHHELPVDNRPIDALWSEDLLPFARLSKDLAAMMMAHVTYPAVDDLAAGYSREWIGNILRQQLGFRGVVFSDDLNMEGAASAGDGAGRAALAVEAGCDLLLVCNNRPMALRVLEWMQSSSLANDQSALALKAEVEATAAPLDSYPEYAVAQDTLKKLALYKAIP